MLFLGHTRFSLYEPDSPSWRLSRSDLGQDKIEYEKALFSETRLRERTRVFFEHTLPTLDIAAQGYRYVHIVSYSENLPSQYKKLLQLAVHKYPWLQLDERKMDSRSPARPTDFLKGHLRNGELYATFRLDDDDILATNFFKRAESFVREENVGCVVSFGLGVQAYLQEGNFFAPRMEHRPKIAIGLLSIGRRSEKGKIYKPRAVAHTKSDLVNVVILDSREIGFIHTMHGSQDSAIDKQDGDFARRFRNYLNLPVVTEDSTRLRELFPTVSFLELERLEGREAELIEWNLRVRTRERSVRVYRKLKLYAQAAYMRLRN